jgi:hypothetical protein
VFALFAASAAKVAEGLVAVVASVPFVFVADDEVPLNVPISRPLHVRLKSRAALTGRTIRRYVTEAIEEKLDRDERDDGPPRSRRR